MCFSVLKYHTKNCMKRIPRLDCTLTFCYFITDKLFFKHGLFGRGKNATCNSLSRKSTLYYLAVTLQSPPKVALPKPPHIHVLHGIAILGLLTFMA